jgi:osmoprotectant transport system substrate-binding protein
MPNNRNVTVGSKNFTEQLLLGELLAQSFEAAGIPVDRRFYLAGSYICHQALLAGRISTYVEYTGTALAAVLKEEPRSGDSAGVFAQVRDAYRDRFHLDVLPSLGFDNTFAMVMRSDDARQHNLRTLSDLAPVSPQMRIGVGYEFLERRDGYNGLISTYGLSFKDTPRVMDLGLLYRALQSHEVDIVAGSNTDGLIAALHLTVLADDKRYFPPYDAVPIVRPDALTHEPRLRPDFARLAGRISADDMRRMNYAIDAEKQDAAIVARRFLESLPTR